MREVIKLESKITQPVKRKRVAAYARVSSGKDAMLHSLSAQISYYNSLIGSRGDWELVGIYADEALTGTKDDRPEFQRMLADCRDGKIDMIITKSVTRMARNTLTLLSTARELKELGIDIFFEKENIHTMSSDGELMLTLLASFAQEESRSASENQKWRIRKMFEQGRPNTGNMLGYRLKDGVLKIVPEEAEIVRQIFADYLSGMGKTAIAKKLTAAQVPARFSEQWGSLTISGILSNEKYTGDMLLQKTYRKDHISKQTIKNRGELPQYYVENSHEPIIDKATFEAVQKEMASRAEKFYSVQPLSPYPFTGLLLCTNCGKHYRRKIANASGKYAKPVWGCPTFNTYGKEVCPAKQIPEAILYDKTTDALGFSDWDRETLLDDIVEIQVTSPNKLTYLFRDGSIKELHWENPSRKQSWTEDMKQVARQRERERQLKISEERRRNHGNTD